MNRYERAYDTDWNTLDKEGAIERAYALGVAASLGEYHPEELDAIRAEMDTTYNRSVVDLAFEEGQSEAREIDSGHDDADRSAWSELVDGEPVTVERDAVSTGGRSGLPAAIDRIGALDPPDRDSTAAVERPEFLERD